MREGRRADARPAGGSTGAWLAVVCAASALLYASWMAGGWINPGLDEVNGYVSGLSARDQPGSALFRATDAAAGVLAVLGALLGLRLCSGRWGRAGWAGLALFGSATLVDAVLTPMDCAPFADTGCALREAFGGVSVAHEMHTVSSSVAGGGALLGMVGLGMAARSGTGRLPRPPVALPFGVITALATVGTLLALLLGGWAGILQRIQLAAISGWLLALAVAAAGRPRRADRGAR